MGSHEYQLTLPSFPGRATPSAGDPGEEPGAEVAGRIDRVAGFAP